MGAPMSKGRCYTLTVETPHWGDEADSIRRLRALLKRLGRGYGVRCVDAKPIEQPRIPNPDGEYSYLLPSTPDQTTTLAGCGLDQLTRPTPAASFSER